MSKIEHDFGQHVARIARLVFRHQDAEVGFFLAQRGGDKTKELMASQAMKQFEQALIGENESFQAKLQEVVGGLEQEVLELKLRCQELEKKSGRQQRSQ